MTSDFKINDDFKQMSLTPTPTPDKNKEALVYLSKGVKGGGKAYYHGLIINLYNLVQKAISDLSVASQNKITKNDFKLAPGAKVFELINKLNQKILQVNQSSDTTVSDDQLTKLNNQMNFIVDGAKACLQVNKELETMLEEENEILNEILSVYDELSAEDSPWDIWNNQEDIEFLNNLDDLDVVNYTADKFKSEMSKALTLLKKIIDSQDIPENDTTSEEELNILKGKLITIETQLNALHDINPELERTSQIDKLKKNLRKQVPLLIEKAHDSRQVPTFWGLGAPKSFLKSTGLNYNENRILDAIQNDIAAEFEISNITKQTKEAIKLIKKGFKDGIPEEVQEKIKILKADLERLKELYTS